VALDTSHPINVLLSYDPVAQTVTVVLQDTVTSQQYTSVTSSIDLATVVGANNAYLGFTGGTGDATSTQTISNFIWTSAAPMAVTAAAFAGFGTTGTGWTLTNGGGPAASVSSNVLTLTESGQGNTANAAWYNTAVDIDQPFAVSYTYTGQANGADGVAFVLQNDSRGTAVVGSIGGGVGYAGIANSLGVVLDIYSNDGAGGAGFQVATNGTMGTFQSASPVGLNTGHPIEVGLVYNPQTQLLDVTLVDSVTGNVFTTQQSVNLAQIVGGNSAILGFTGGDGGTTATQTIANFQFQPLQSAAFSGGAPWSSVATSGAVFPQIQNNAVQLTAAGTANSATALWYGSQLPVTSPFQVNFTYTGQTTGDEGIALVFQNDPAGLTALGSAGTGLGYAGIENSLALLLDIGAGNGTALATNGELPVLGSTGPVNLQAGHPIAVSLVFDPVRNLLIETLTDTVTSHTFTQTYTQSNLAGLLQGTSAWVGFTAGTSANGANQTVSNFSIVTLPPVAPVVLSAQGSILANSSSSLIQGNVLSLQAGQQSVTGSLGTTATPLPIQLTPITRLGNSYPGSVTASAPQDINLVAPTGNLVVGSIVSPAGTVSLQAQAGSIVSASGLTNLNIPMNELSGAQLQQMVDTVDAAIEASTTATVNAFEDTVNSLYLQYWNILDNSTLTVGNLAVTGSQLLGGAIQGATFTPASIPFWTSATAGVFYIAVTNTLGQTDTTTALDYDSTASEIAAAINALTNPSGGNLLGSAQVTVTGTGTQVNPWVLSGQLISNLQFATGGLTGGSAGAGAATPGTFSWWTNATAGDFLLSVVNAAGQTATVPLPWNSTSSQIQGALRGLLNSDGTPFITGLRVTGAGTQANPWIVSGNAMASMTATGVAPLASPLAVGGLTVEPQQVGSISVTTSGAAGGTFTLTVTNPLGQSATTAALPYNSTASQIQTALNALSIVGAGALSVELVSAQSWEISGPSLTSVTADSSQLTADLTIGQLSASSQPFYTTATGGMFGLTVTNVLGQSATTGALAYNSSASQIEQNIRYSNIQGVSRMTVTGEGTASNPWIISGQELAGVASPWSELDSIQAGSTTWSSSFWTNDSADSFTLSVQLYDVEGSNVETTSPLAGNSTASQVQAALQALPIFAASSFTVKPIAGWSRTQVRATRTPSLRQAR
jgi:hypothetical protein